MNAGRAGQKITNTAAGIGAAVLSAMAVSPFAAKLLAKEPLPVQQGQEKAVWSLKLSGFSMSYSGKKGEQSVESGTITLDGQFSSGITGKHPSEITESDLFAGGCVDNVFVMVGAKGIGAIWISTSPNIDDKIVLFSLPFTATSAEFDQVSGVITVNGENGEQRKYRVFRGPKNMPQLLEEQAPGKK
ncbi:MAG: hypothetical protein QW568_01905 [Candidatus Anstonellaceae archaeon]